MLQKVQELPLDFVPDFDEIEEIMDAFKLGSRMGEIRICSSVFHCSDADVEVTTVLHLP